MIAYIKKNLHRANRSLKDIMYRHFAHTNSLRYLDILPKLLDTYNRRKHRVIGMTPAEAEKPSNAAALSYNLNKNLYMKRLLKRKPKFKIGTKVRIAETRNTFHRSWDPTFRLDVYEITSISRKFPIPTYKVKAIEDGIPLLATFYGSEFLKVPQDDIET